MRSTCTVRLYSSGWDYYFLIALVQNKNLKSCRYLRTQTRKLIQNIILTNCHFPALCWCLLPFSDCSISMKHAIFSFFCSCSWTIFASPIKVYRKWLQKKWNTGDINAKNVKKFCCCIWVKNMQNFCKFQIRGNNFKKIHTVKVIFQKLLQVSSI